ncbi:MAG: putative DNA binding domain-containing protein [Bacteroidales bacterium]|nr:putative DNA binding domain-containing protein [Bacteroidales bacterium]
MSETQNIEYKESWREEYLKWICGFANAQGGSLYIGIADDQSIVGVTDAKRLMEDIPNKIVNYLGIVADVNLHVQDNKEYIEIVVEPSPIPISFRGAYHYRAGSTKQVLNGAALQQFLMRKMGRTWDDIERLPYNEDVIDRGAIDYFLRKGIQANRIDSSLQNEDTHTVLDSLDLLAETGALKNAAILLFGKRPQKYFTGIQFKIGRFGVDESDLLFDDIVEGNILQMADKVVELLKSKYLILPIHYEGMQRVAPLEVPEDALREMLYNAIVHRDQRGSGIMMWVYDDHIELWNEGPLPENMNVDTLLKKHKSRQRNPKIARVFYLAGMIETWGRGIHKICKAFNESGMELPMFEETEGGVAVSFKRKIPRTTEQTPEQVTDTSKDTSKYTPTDTVDNQEPFTHHISTTQVPHKYHISSTQVKSLWDKMEDNKEYSTIDLMRLMEVTNKSYFTKSYLQPAIQNEIIELLYPDHPRHPRQKYHRKR